MIRAAFLAGFSALLGGAIALVARRRPAVLERTRTFAFAAAAGVVAFHLLPEVLPSQGLAALLWMAVGFALPWALEAGARAMGPGILQSRGIAGLRVSAEVGFAALLFHSVAEGLALVAALAQPSGQLDLEIALIAHHAPLTAAVVLPFLDLRGPRTVAARAAAVGAAGVAGALLSRFVPGFTEGAFLDTATAVTAGALLHVVSDEIRAQRLGSAWERAADLGACVAGLLVAGLSAVLQLRRNQAAGPLFEFLRVFGGIALRSAPAILFGAIAGALLAARTRFFRWDALLLALVLLGPLFATALGVLTVLFAIGGPRDDSPAGGVLQELVGAVRRRAPPLLALLFVAAGLEVASSPFPTAIVPLLPLTIGLVLCARLDEAGAVAVAAVMVHKGLDPGIAVVVLAIGPWTRRFSVRTAIVGSVSIVALWRSGFLDRAAVAAQAALGAARDPIGAQAARSPLGAASAVVLVAIALGTLWTAGVRGWFAPLRHGPRTA
jgi:hypothetical protein